MLKEIEIDTDPFDHSIYQENGFYKNSINGEVYVVNKVAMYVGWIGRYVDVKEAFEQSMQQESQKQTGISEEYSLKLVQTIIRELK